MASFDIIQQRLHNQRLLTTSFTQAAEVVHWLAASQAQDYAGAKWALGLRLQNASDDLIAAAFAQGQILRTHLLRPTWHFVTPADIRWLLALTAPRVQAVNGTMYRQLELDAETLRRSTAVLTHTLQGGQHLTRGELRQTLQNAGIAADNSLRMGYMMMYAELEGVICSGPRRGKQFTYALLDERVPSTRPLSHEEALAELGQRYFTSRGPATVYDFAKWSGLTVTDARHGLEAVKSRLESVEVDGQTYWLPPADFATDAVSPRAFFLSIYDEYISGYKDRGAMGSPAVEAQLFALGNALFYIMVVDGQVIGSCRRTLHKDTAVIEMNLMTPLTAAQEQAVATAGHQYGTFLGLATELRW